MSTDPLPTTAGPEIESGTAAWEAAKRPAAPAPETLAEQVDEALAPTVGRLYAESLRVANDETLARLAQQSIQIGRGDILHLHLSVLLDTLLGDMDDPRRQEYEVAVHTKLAELLAEVSAQAARATLLQGVQQRTVPNPFPNGPHNGRRRG